MSRTEDGIDLEIVEVWQAFMQALLAILMLTGAAVMAYYGR